MMDAKIANEIFRYDAESGKLFWRIKPNGRVALGAEITSESAQGYIRVSYKGRRYLVHRIIWLMRHGKFPNGQIDHIDHDRRNNRLTNLRDVDNSSNQRNRSIQKNNTSGFLGVIFHKKRNKWQVQGTTSDGINKHIGYFDTKEDAIEARKAFNRENGYHPNHGS